MIETAPIVFAVVVTYNRKQLLMQCLTALANQTQSLSKIIIVDNASTDGTLQELHQSGLLENPCMQLLSLAQNTGGAGGFSAGMQYAFEQGADYVWMMDDDAMPYLTALEELMKYATPQHIYASLAIQDQQISWEMTVKNGDIWRATHNPADILAEMEVYSLPFLGFMIHREIVEKIGLPDTSFFIAADDTEYCLRAKQAGFKLYLTGQSLIEHPKAQHQEYKILGKKINYVSLPPWKRYYDTRNRIFIAKKYFGFKLYSQTIPSILFRLCISMLVEKNKYLQLKAYYLGLYDGLTAQSGKRHEHRGLI
ncbi:glycosyl transferase [Acinetobacter sp. WCHA45]|nr:glycosyl transferase [Acinetobacter sp. WCHA45]